MKDFDLINQIKTEVVVVDKNMTVVEANMAFQQRNGKDSSDVIGTKCFNSAYNFSEGCGYKKAGDCPVRRSFLTKEPARAIHHFWIDDHAVVEELTTTPIIEKNGDVNYVIEEYRDVTKLLGLKKGIISICSYCRKIRDENDQWVSFEAYLQKHTGANFSHGICEDCSEDLISEHTHSRICSH